MPFNLKLKYQDHLLWLMTSDIEQQHHHHLFNILYLFMISKFFPPFFSEHLDPSWVSLTAGMPCSSCATSPPLAINEAKAFGGPLDLQAGLQRRSCSKGSSHRLQTKGAGNGWMDFFEGEQPNSYVGWMNASDIEVESWDWKVRRCFVCFSGKYDKWMWKKNNGTCLIKDVFFLERRGIEVDLSLSK